VIASPFLPAMEMQRVTDMATSTPIAANLSINPLDARPTFVPSNLLRGLDRQPQLVPASGSPDSPRTGIAHSADPVPHVTFSPASAVRPRIFQTVRMAAELVQGTDKAQFESHIRSPYHTLIAYERGSRKDGKTVIEGLPPSSIHDLTHKLVFVPAGAEYRDQHTPRTNLSAVYFHFSPDILPRDVGQDAASLAPRLFFEHASLWNSVLKLKEMLEDPAFEEEPYFEALGVLLAHEIVHAHSTLSVIQPPARGGLAPWQQRIVTGYIEEHLTEAIPLSTLAGLVHLSPYYFCRAFKQSLGVPPHRYHINRRIERAKHMLLEREQSVTHIGLALGFGETSSFSAAFRKATGTTPTGYQRNAG
jgi:AraC family transcriptional regulator